MPVTSRRGTLREDAGVYKQLTFWVAGGEAHELRFVWLSPVRWQELYKESHLLRGARTSTSAGSVTILFPIAGREMEALCDPSMEDDAFVISRDRWDPSR